MADPRQIEAPKQVLVEGRDAEEFFKALLDALSLQRHVQVQDYGGISQLRPFLKGLVAAPGFDDLVRCVAVVRDAERRAGAALQSVCDALRMVSLAVPEQAGQYADGPPRTGVFIFPDGVSPGMLEDLCLKAVEDDCATECVNEYFGCLSTREVPPSKNLQKARLQAFLASRERPGLLLGQAAHAGYFPWGSKAFLDLINFVRAL